MNLEFRLERLEALQDIAASKARYAALADAKYRPDHQRVDPAEWRRIAGLQAGCFTDDAVWDGGATFGGALAGRAAIAEWFSRSPWRYALHYYVAPQITLTSAATAEAEWRLWQVGIRDGETSPVLLAGRTVEAYRRESETWLITRMRFTQIHVANLGADPVSLTSLIPSQA